MTTEEIMLQMGNGMVRITETMDKMTDRMVTMATAIEVMQKELDALKSDKPKPFKNFLYKGAADE